MYRHYLVTAIKVLLRRKFFSFVNLFGIAITLAVITAATAIVNNYVAPIGAESRAENYLAASRLQLTNEEGTSSWDWALGYRFIERYVYPLETPDDIGIFREAREGTVFVDDTKLTPDVVSTDAGYWRIMAFRFIDGSPISEDDVHHGRTVAVLNTSTATAIFGNTAVAGESFTLNGRTFTVVGVVEDEPSTRMHASGEIWVPHSSEPSAGYQESWVDGFTAIAYVESKAELPRISEEYRGALQSFEYDDPEQFQVANSAFNSKLETLARTFNEGNVYGHEPQLRRFIVTVCVALLAFMFLPAINLINLNVSRIMERASEIGVRKAFGASVRTMIGQFLMENLILCLLGGIVGIGLGIAILELIESSGQLPYASFVVGWNTIAVTFGVIVVFSALSGIYPAWKMARMEPVTALKGG